MSQYKSMYFIRMMEELERNGIINLSNIDLSKVSKEVIEKLEDEARKRHSSSGGDCGPYGCALWAPFVSIGVSFCYYRFTERYSKNGGNLGPYGISLWLPAIGILWGSVYFSK